MTMLATAPFQHVPQPDPNGEPPLRAVPMSLFPTFGSLKEAMEFADSRLPITDKNELVSLLMSYHNTLLAVAAK